LALDPDSEAAAQRMLEYGQKVDPQAAIESTRAYLDKHPGSRRLQLMLVNRYVERGEFDAAIAQIQAMRKQAPEDFDLLYNEAQVNVRAERYAQAQTLLREYISVQTQRRK